MLVILNNINHVYQDASIVHLFIEVFQIRAKVSEWASRKIVVVVWLDEAPGTLDGFPGAPTNISVSV